MNNEEGKAKYELQIINFSDFMTMSQIEEVRL